MGEDNVSPEERQEIALFKTNVCPGLFPKYLEVKWAN